MPILHNSHESIFRGGDRASAGTHGPRAVDPHKTIKLDLRIRVSPSSLGTRPELLHPVQLPYDPRRQYPVRQIGPRNLQRDDVANLVSLGRLRVAVLGPLAQVPVWYIRLSRDVYTEFPLETKPSEAIPPQVRRHLNNERTHTNNFHWSVLTQDLRDIIHSEIRRRHLHPKTFPGLDDNRLLHCVLVVL